VDGTKIVAVFDFRNAPHGLYDVTVINPNGDQANLPYRFLIEPAIEPDVVIGLGGTRVMWAGDTGYHGLSLVNDTNVDLPYVYVQVGVPELGINYNVFLPYVTLSTNLSGMPGADVPALANVPWASLDSETNTSGYALASGYAVDLVNRGFAGMNFTVLTYSGNKGWSPDYPAPRAVGFTYQILAAATPLTSAEFVERQRAEAEKLRRAIIADATATPA